MSNFPKLEFWVDKDDVLNLSYWDFDRGEDVHYKIAADTVADRRDWTEYVSLVNLSEDLKALFNKIVGIEDGPPSK